MNYTIILAGGRGDRFWPLSSEAVPKQFHNINSRSTLLQNTIRRIKKLIPAKNIYIATNKAHRKIIIKQIRQFNIPTKNLFFEPSPKNTLAPIGYLSRRILDNDPEAVISVLPSDHLIDSTKKFVNIIKAAIRLAKNGYIVTLGTIPIRPDTGYGYIRLGKRILYNPPTYRVERFVEKPSKDKAQKLLKSKRYLWNCGIFIFKAGTIMQEIRRHTLVVNKTIIKLIDSKKIDNTWAKLPSISIDYGIMEKIDNACVIPINFRWQDLGNWLTVGETLKKDRHGNIFKGRVLNIGSKNITVWADQGLVATIGLRDIIVVNANNKILVCSKEHVQDVKEIALSLREKGLTL